MNEIIERLSTELHAVYQGELDRQGVSSKHARDYADLPEQIKELDRALARFIVARDRAIRAAVLEQAVNHSQHHIFSVHSGEIVQSSCACGEQFPTQGSCEAWKQHILSLATSADRDALRERDAKLRLDEHKIACSICACRGGLHKDGLCARGDELEAALKAAKPRTEEGKSDGK